jgi:hypothetical protein
MTTNSHAAETALPRMFGQRDYRLPDSVQTNISRQHYDGAPGMWDYARGLLIETCLVLPWTPLTLFLGVEPFNDEETSAVVVTIVAQDENRDIVTVVWRQDHGVGAQGQDVWQLTINGAVHHHRGSTHVRPSPPILASIIRDTING